MQKEDITKLKEQAEAKCRLYFDQLTTLQNSVAQTATQLEQERGAARALAELEQMWPAPRPADPLPTASEGPVQDFTPEPAKLPVDDSLIPVPSNLKAKREK